MQTLEQLKAENAEHEAQAQQESAPVESVIDEEAAEVETQETDEAAEPEAVEGEETEVESWMQSEEQTSNGEFTGSDIAAAKRKLRAKLEKKHESELDELRAKIASLEANPAQAQPQTQVKAMPKLEDFDYDDTKYQAAMQQWVGDQVQTAVNTATSANTQTQQQQAAQAQLEAQVNSHYERAQKLANDNGIAPDVYQQADHAVRSAIDSVLPGSGDAVTDQIIAQLGDGSEKVLFMIGRNPSKREALISKLKNDPTGIQASMYLGELKATASAPTKRKTQAPAPSRKVTGDDSGGVSEQALKRRYNSAKDPQARFDARREARQAGIDTSKW